MLVRRMYELKELQIYKEKVIEVHHSNIKGKLFLDFYFLYAGMGGKNTNMTNSVLKKYATSVG